MAKFTVKVEDCAWLWLDVDVEASSVEEAMEKAHEVANASAHHEWAYVESALPRNRLFQVDDHDNQVSLSLFDGDVLESCIPSHEYGAQGNSLCDAVNLVTDMHELLLVEKYGKKRAKKRLGRMRKSS